MNDLMDKVIDFMKKEYHQKKYEQIVSEYEGSFRGGRWSLFTPWVVRYTRDMLLSRTKSDVKKVLIETVYGGVVSCMGRLHRDTVGEFHLGETVYNVLSGKEGEITFIAGDNFVLLSTDDAVEVPVAFLRKVKPTRVEHVYSREEGLYDKVHASVVNTDALYFFKDIYKGVVDLAPFYQRGMVWSLDQKVAYIEALLQGHTVVGFSLIEVSYAEHKRTGYSYEVLDGKQRIATLMEFMEGKFSIFGGVFFENLSKEDMYYFMHLDVRNKVYVGVGDKEISDGLRIRLYLDINANVPSQREEHISKLRSMLRS